MRSEHVGFFQIWVMFVERWRKVTWSMLFLLNNREQAGQLLGANPAYREYFLLSHLDENKTLLFFEIEKWQLPKEREIQTPWRLIDVRRYM